MKTTYLTFEFPPQIVKTRVPFKITKQLSGRGARGDDQRALPTPRQARVPHVPRRVLWQPGQPQRDQVGVPGHPGKCSTVPSLISI